MKCPRYWVILRIVAQSHTITSTCMDHIESHPQNRIRERLSVLTASLFYAYDAATFAVFRILFGLLMAGEAFFSYYPDAHVYYSPDRFHFTYSFFHWVEPWPGNGMYIHIAAMGVAALGISLGLFYRASSIVFTILYTHVFLIEATTYNNHYYLIILLGGLFSVTNAHSALSLDRLRKPAAFTGTVPLWHVALFRAQIIIVYFYGGMAKLNWDWLRGEPMRTWITGRGAYPVLDKFIGDHFIREEWIVYFTSYGGLIFDLVIGFALLYRRTRIAAVIPLLFFHGTNMYMFDIGIFPPLAVSSTLLFFPGDLPRKLIKGLRASAPNLAQVPSITAQRRRTATALLAIYMSVQLLMPFRHWLYPGNVSWTEEGHILAWHMKLRTKSVNAEFHVKDTEGKLITTYRKTKQLRDLTEDQRAKMLLRPQLIIQYAHYLRDRHAERGLDSPQIYADISASLNGRPYRPLIDPEVNLAQAHYSPIWPSPWILPLEEDLPIGLYK